MTDTVEVADDAAPPPSDPRWAEVLQRVVDQPDLLTLHAQPIVELTSGAVAGYEMLARFRGPWSAPPDQWFTAADRWGVNALLQARVLRAGIAARGMLPPNTFLTVNIDPHLLAHADIVEVLTAAPDLTRLVLELTEHTQALEGAGVAEVLAQVRRAGAMLAMDDAGTGYAGLSQLLTLRPHMVKLDRELINGIDTDPVKAALVEVFGDLAGRMDTWILAEGIETESELDTLIRLGVPLGQGWALARPAPSMLETLAPTIVDHIRTTALRSSLDGYVASLVRPVEVGLQRAGSAVSGSAVSGSAVSGSAVSGSAVSGSAVSLDGNGLATAVRVDDGAWLPATLVSPSTLVVDAARRAMTRDLRYRYAPLVCTDGQGQVIGTIGIDDLLLALCSSGSPAIGR